MEANKPRELMRVGELEVLQLDDSSWRIRDLSAVDAPCPILGVVDRTADSFRVTLLDRPAESERYSTLDAAIRAVEARRFV